MKIKNIFINNLNKLKFLKKCYDLIKYIYILHDDEYKIIYINNM